MARKRTGTLVWTGKQYSVRFASGPLIPLHTDDKRVAQARRSRLANDPAATGAHPDSTVETFEEAARRLVQVQLDASVPSAKARASRLRRWAYPILGAMKVTKIRPGHVTSVLEHVASLGRSSTTLTHMRGDMIYVFGRLLKEEVITRNPARGELVDTPPGVDDPRPRTVLRDEEFIALIDAPTTPPQLRMMALVARCFGGMRTSDLRAWEWIHIDINSWVHADVPRPKTSAKRRRRAPGESPYQLERLALPEAVAAELHAWWVAAGRPRTGPVFRFPPARKSFAADLRAALLAAGQERHELHHDVPVTPRQAGSRRVDFHSFRRAWSTAIGAAGLNAQTAMKVTGHRQMTTHMRYVRPETITIPASAVPTWSTGGKHPQNAGGLLFEDPGPAPTEWDKALELFLCEGEDSNLHGSYPASTSSESDCTQYGTNAPLLDRQSSENSAVSEVSWIPLEQELTPPGARVVASKLSIGRGNGVPLGAMARTANAALTAHLRALATAIAADLGHRVPRTTQPAAAALPLTEG